MIHHAALVADWVAARSSGEYTISTRGLTLEAEGFIHCSYRHQLEGVANRFYADLAELILLTIDPALTAADVVDEPPADGIDELFPHVYGPITIAAIIRAAPWRRDPDGVYRLTNELFPELP